MWAGVGSLLEDLSVSGYSQRWSPHLKLATLLLDCHQHTISQPAMTIRLKFTALWDTSRLTFLIRHPLAAVRTSEMSVYFNEHTWHIPEGWSTKTWNIMTIRLFPLHSCHYYTVEKSAHSPATISSLSSLCSEHVNDANIQPFNMWDALATIQSAWVGLTDWFVGYLTMLFKLQRL
jgi:hypothetical protein